MNCNDCGGFLPRGCECSPFGGRKTRADDEAFQQHQRDRIAEAQRHDAEQTKPKLTRGVTGRCNCSGIGHNGVSPTCPIHAGVRVADGEPKSP